ncbi:MAG: response regulator [Anaerolineales bacterium]|nr:response regulator [Anaerolineales bacterium]
MATKILIVDDNLESLDLLDLLLRRTGYETMTAPTAESGLASARQERPDLILLDIVLPDMDGYQVLETLRSSKETRGTPVILITGKVQQGDKIKAHRAGADAYLQRPFSPQELFRSIEAALREDQ